MTSDKTLIILDTNYLKESNKNKLIYPEFSSRKDFNDFLRFLEKEQIKDKIVFGIPEVVFEEHFFHRNNNFLEDLEYLKDKIEQFNQMDILESGKLNLTFKEDFNYKEFLYNLVDKGDNFIFLKIDEDKKKELFDKTLKKAISHQKPFHKKGDRNLKDSIIWECICCQNFRNYAVVIFLNQNEDDFPKNDEIDEINSASEKTGKLIHILHDYDKLENELDKIYMFAERDVKEYVLENRDRIKEDIEDKMDCILWTFDLDENSIKITEPKYGDLEHIGFEEKEENRNYIKIINFGFKAKAEFSYSNGEKENQKFMGEIFFDNNVKEIIWSRYDVA